MCGFPGASSCALRRGTGMLQIEIADLMASANNFTRSYAKALVLSTSRDGVLGTILQEHQERLTSAEVRVQNCQRIEKPISAGRCALTISLRNRTLTETVG